jgi:hypothetical protein
LSDAIKSSILFGQFVKALNTKSLLPYKHAMVKGFRPSAFCFTSSENSNGNSMLKAPLAAKWYMVLRPAPNY